MKKIILPLISAIALVAHADFATKTVDYRASGSPIGYTGRIVSAYLGSTVTNGTFNLSVSRKFEFDVSNPSNKITTVVSQKTDIFSGSYSSNSSNVVFSTPIYVSASDRVFCDGTNATNSTAKAILFIEK